MRQCAWLFCLAMFLPAVLTAGQIYGSVVSAGRALSRAGITISCGGSATPGATAEDGSYRMNVPQGRCTFELTGYQGRPSADVFSYPNPTQYNFELLRRPDGSFELRRR